MSSDTPAVAPATFPTIRDAVEEAETDMTPIETVESLCMDCGEDGLTRILLTFIPYFREVIVMSFRCEHCGCQNNEIKAAGEIQPRGCSYTVKVTARADLDRQLVKSDSCTVSIPELQLQVPAARGQFTTIEGIVRDTIRDLSADQDARRASHADVAAKIDALLDELRSLVDVAGEEEKDKRGGEIARTFTVKLDDPAGNSFIEARGGLADPKWSKREYERTREQDEALGLSHDDRKEKKQGEDGDGDNEEAYPEEVHSFPSQCGLCGSEQETLMKTINIPHFKDVVLMSTNCHSCGYRDNEIKSGGAIAEQGRKITLKVDDSDDLSRDILKSDTAGLEIPEIDLELQPGTLGGRFTTLEGLLNQIYEELDEKVFAGDSADTNSDSTSMDGFLAKLKQVREAAIPFTVVIDDPLANSYIQNLYAPDDDPNMTIELYDRTHEQNEELGLNDMRTEVKEDGTY